MSCSCGNASAGIEAERHVVRSALVLNGLMFVVGIGCGVVGHSTSVLADALDMAADSAGYTLALLAISRGEHFRATAARWTGGALAVLSLAIVAEAVRRWFGDSEPLGTVMMGYSIVSLCVNVYVLARLAKIRKGGVHLNASYICTRTDVLANIGVFASGAIVLFTGVRWIDLLAGAAIALFVFSEAREILEKAKEAEGA